MSLDLTGEVEDCGPWCIFATLGQKEFAVKLAMGPIQYNDVRADSRFAPNQWEMFCNDISNWLGASLESALRCHLTIIGILSIKMKHSWDIILPFAFQAEGVLSLPASVSLSVRLSVCKL